jgi:hypothetical protein
MVDVGAIVGALVEVACPGSGLIGVDANDCSDSEKLMATSSAGPSPTVTRSKSPPEASPRSGPLRAAISPRFEPESASITVRVPSEVASTMAPFLATMPQDSRDRSQTSI